ncbi:MAG: putative 4-mercaptohistidine N1-methyltransferase [Verrucomicrobia bacterium]|nr:putative 4-mercaptohistidine N1-methyltransferase [Verrucomicrobiota bacterium]
MEQNPYETSRLLSEYLLFHYGSAEEILPAFAGSSHAPREALGFPARVVRECVPTLAVTSGRALDVGCAVGRASFELARQFPEVVGIDFSRNFIAAAEELRATGRIGYTRTDEGLLTTPLVATVPREIARRRVRFEVGDACKLDAARLGQFDMVLAINLIDRLPAPGKFLAALPALVQPGGGRLILASPYTWLEEYTPKSEWLGGFVDASGRRVQTLDSLRATLAPDFDLIETRDLPFLIREHARKFQWSVSQASIWQRR